MNWVLSDCIVSRHIPFYSQGGSIRRDYFFDILLPARKDLEGLLFVRSCVKYVPPIILSHLILLKTSWNRNSYHPQFTDEEAEAGKAGKLPIFL